MTVSKNTLVSREMFGIFPPACEELTNLTSNTRVTFDSALAHAFRQSQTVEDTPPPRKKRCCFSFRRPPQHAQSVWTKIFHLSRVPYIETDLVHKGILNSLHFHITGHDAPSELQNVEWKKIGFQDANPAGDIRAGGILGLLLPLWLFEKCPGIGERVVKIMYTGNEKTQLMLILINFAFLAIEVAGTTSLLEYSNGEEEAWNYFLAFFGGVTESLCASVESGKIVLFTEVEKVRDLMNSARDRPKRVVDAFLRNK